MKAKRERLNIIYDILRAIQVKDGLMKPTHIMYKANLSHKMLEEYLKELISRGFITEKTAPKGRTYALTDKGFDYISKYKLITGFIASFGLD
jgi:predicted transcriptional regulator